MSTTQNPVLPDAQTAYNNLFNAVHQQVFFNKCAAAGLYPRNPAEAQYMLNTAGKLRLLEQEVGVKQADDFNSPYAQADQLLDNVLAQHGLGGGIKQAQADEQEMAIRQAALDLCADPTLYNSVLALKVAEANQIQEQLQQRQPA